MKRDRREAWKKFEQSGHIRDYLDYCRRENEDEQEET